MEPARETEPRANADETPLPMQVDGFAVPSAPATGAPTVAAVLGWIAGSAGPWFPARFAADTGTPRDSLDEPLAELRLAGLVLATEWVRGVGQGYVLTDAGKAAVADPAALDRLRAGAPAAEVAALAAATVARPPGPPADEQPADEPTTGELALRPPVVVPALLMANAVWFFVCAVWGIRWGLTLARSVSEGHPEVLHRFGAVSGPDLLAGEWWRLFTCCFVHIGALHLIGNLFALAMMGPLAELLWGRGRLLFIYLVSGLAGSALAMALRPDALLAGASGAIWGIQMSLFMWLWTFRSKLPPDLAADWFRRLTVVFLLNAAVSFLPSVSWEGHLGGGLAGLAAAGLLNVARGGGPARRLGAWLALTLLPLLCVGGLAAAIDAKGMTRWQEVRKRVAAEREAREWLDTVERWREAAREYDARAVPLLNTFAPARTWLPLTLRFGLVLPEEFEAQKLVRRTARTADESAAVRAKLLKRKQDADELAARTAGPPVGLALLDDRRDLTHRFAVARARSLELLMLMLDASGPPAPAAVKLWDDARAEAERLWEALRAQRPPAEGG